MSNEILDNQSTVDLAGYIARVRHIKTPAAAEILPRAVNILLDRYWLAPVGGKIEQALFGLSFKPEAPVQFEAKARGTYMLGFFKRGGVRQNGNGDEWVGCDGSSVADSVNPSMKTGKDAHIDAKRYALRTRIEGAAGF